ncbi:hypothetical protein GA0061081_10167 [Gilliamella bombicola]|uniref:Uncharacterized protein n=3 Tax=Gilliamella TaxID=1193503 RepID=A0A1C3YQZ4_9GAMM|nr:hypothetical protein GA0061081_10167 [Gilliamella bombicola]
MALTASTSRYIEGSAPYLTFDGGQTRTTSTDSFLFIKLRDGTRYTPSTNPSSATDPIRLPYAGSTLGDIDMVIPSSVDSVSLSDLITRYNYWGDDDGDGQGINGVTATGDISVSFVDKDGNTVNRSDALDICKAPYKVTLSSTDGYLQTEYGVPNRASFNGQTVTYYINPYGVTGPVVCHARPNLRYGHIDYAGPSNIWSSTKGFLTQSISSSSYDQNFPTTGTDGAYFDLDIGGADGSQLTWSVVTNGSIRAEVSWTRPRSGSFTDLRGYTVQADNWITDKSSYVTRVTLSGPRADSAQISSNSPSSLIVPSLPQTFELVGRDGRGHEVRYGFVLKQWFVNRGNKRDTLSNQSTWCGSLGYRLPQIKDLTNAMCGALPAFPCRNGIDGSLPSSFDDHYMRHMGAGFFSEWGSMSRYADLGFIDDAYWTSDTVGANGFYVGPAFGHVSYFLSSFSYWAVCTTP